MLTLAVGQCVRWHYHGEITERLIYVKGLMAIETGAPPTTPGRLRITCRAKMVEPAGSWSAIGSGPQFRSGRPMNRLR